MHTKKPAVPRSGWIATILATVIAGGGVVAQAASSTTSHHSPIVWDQVASSDLEGAYHRLHEAWNMMDIAKLKSLIVGDDKLVTYDIDPESGAPVKLRTKAELDRFTDKIFDGFKTSKIKSVAEHPIIACRVSGSLGICTEECRVQLFLPDGTKQVQQLRASAVAVNDDGTWRFIQWHMSPNGPIENYDGEGRRVDAAQSRSPRLAN